VLRTGERARNIQRLTEIRDQDSNMAAAVTAVKVLEDVSDATRRGTNVSINITPGVVVDLSAQKPAPLIDHQEIIELNPLENNEAVGHDE
jgi:hypothetical protein